MWAYSCLNACEGVEVGSNVDGSLTIVGKDRMCGRELANGWGRDGEDGVQKDGVDIPTHHGVVALAGWEED